MSSSSTKDALSPAFGYRALPTSPDRSDLSRIRPLSYGTKCALTAAVVVGLVGLVLIGLSFASSIGPIGSPGFFASWIMGAAITLCAAGLIALLIFKQTDREEGSSVGGVRLGVDTYDGSGAEDVQQGLPPPPILSAPQNPQIFVSAALQQSYELLQNAVNLPDVQVEVEPINRDIKRYMQLREQLKGRFLDELERFSENPWTNDNVVRAFDPLMTVSFTISMLTLRELNSEGANLLQLAGTYPRRAFEYCSDYFVLAFEGKRVVDGQLVGIQTREALGHHAVPFYQQGTPQHNWRMLYNAFCDEIPSILGREQLPQRIDALDSSRSYLWLKSRASDQRG